jgi:endonuclease YncB( thermonuclease family)
MIRLFLSVLLLVPSSLLFSQQLTPDVIQGKVVGITDGDTLTILMDSKQYKIRLAEIDTPERNQPYGSKAKDVLSDLVFNKEVKAEVQDVDRYGRYVARIYVGELDVSREMVRLGAAWVYRQYLRDKSLLDVEAEAKVAKRGLWSLPEAQKIPPWEWRRGARQSNIEMPEGCEAKRYCREMTSCQEAQHYLNQCGISSLDGDRDGLACEALCR